MQLFKKKRAEPDIESMRQTVRRNGRTLFDHGTGDADGAYEMKRNAERDNLLDVFHPGAAKPSYNILVLAPMRQGDPVTFRCSCWSWRNEHRESKAGWCKHTLGAERLYALAKDVVGVIDHVVAASHCGQARSENRYATAPNPAPPPSRDQSDPPTRRMANLPMDVYGTRFWAISPRNSRPARPEQGGASIWLS